MEREYASLERLALRRLDRTGPETFVAESRLPFLQARFASVSRLYRGGSVMCLTQRDLQRYLDGYVEMYGQMLAADGPYPFTPTRKKCVFVADAAL